MAKEICISTTPHETRLAILEDDQLAEIYYERENEYTLAGSIYKGRVTRVLPGMQSSFVDVGLERDAFLYVTDFLEEQEDSEDYVSESNRRPRQDAPAGEDADPERGAADHAQDRSGERSSEARGGDRGQARGQEDRGRRGGVAAEGGGNGRAGRERAREQAVAPLREAVPAPQDLEEKGDEELPAGTRRWRGRRGRRRGVRGGIGDAQAGSPAEQQTREPVERIEAVGLSVGEVFATPEHGAPGGLADFQPDAGASLLPLGEEQGMSQPSGSQARSEGRGRDRSSRRPREPYAQASTLGRREQPSPEPATEPQAAQPASATGAIVLPGESLSKYGSSPVPAPTAAVTATVPRAASRPVNYVAAKPSTLVELGADWDGGAVLPGETISRYRGESTAAVSEQQQPSETSLDPQTQSSPETTDAPAVDASEEASHEEIGVDQVDAEVATHGDLPDAAPVPLAEPEVMAAAVSPEAEAGPADVPVAESVHEGAPESGHQAEASVMAEPEELATTEATGTEQPETAPATGAEAATAGTEEPQAAEPETAEPLEYDPENASASYRMPPTGASEMRLAGFDNAEPEAAELESHEPHASSTGDQALAEPEGTFAGGVQEPANEPAAEHAGQEVRGEVPEFGGELHATGDANLPARSAERPEIPAADEPRHALSILHQDGTIESWPASTVPSSASEAAAPAEISSQQEPGHVAEAPEAQGFETPGFETPNEGGRLDWAAQVQQADAELLASPASSTPFSDLVEKLQGFSPGSGFIEEEVIDEDEYDFEPLHAHAHGDDGDHEDLEEETLDHSLEPAALSDAVRESHLNQRVHEQEPAEDHSHAHAHAEEEAESHFRLEELDEEEGEEDGQGEVAGAGSQAPEPERQGRSEEERAGGRDRGRGRGAPRNGGRSSGGRNGGRGRSAQTQDLPVISDMLKQGQEILVQIAKEPMAKKGARITSHIALPGRFLVFMPTVSHVGVSRKIASDEERQRLKRILISEKGDSSGGFIVRTAAEGAGEEDLRADLRFLISLWTEIKQRSDSAKAPALIYHDLNLIERILRDQVSSNFSTIWVDSESEYERIIRFLNRFQPALVRRVKLYTKETPLFEHFGIQDEISKALKSKVWLKSGGSIVINQTEALVAIDINTGKYVGKTARLEDTIVKTNLDAIPEIVRQIRLRDLGGIIVIDFIDMDERKNRNRVLAALEEELKHDRAPSKVLQFNDFGLVAITRKRVKQSLERTLSVQCETCTGTGMVKSPVTVCNEIYIEMRKMQKHLDGKDVMLRVHPEVVKQLKAGNGKWINELEEMVAKTIIIKSDPALHPEQFDIH